MDALELKHHLEAVKAAGYSAEGVDTSLLVSAMVTHIGNPDPVVRDALIYPTFARWMGTVIAQEEMRRLLGILLDAQHLFYRMGEQNTDSVFTRSFSILTIVLIIYQHRKKPFLSKAELRNVLSQLSEYAVREQDLRGYTGDTGWAHAIAHLADLLDELAVCEEMTRSELLKILDGVCHTMSSPISRYDYDEDERMAYATLSLFGRGILTKQDSVDWIQSLAEPVADWQGWSEDIHQQRANLKQFLRSLYFQALYKKQIPELVPTIVETHKAITNFK